MIHVYDFTDKLIDFVSVNENVVREAKMDIDVEKKVQTYEFEILQNRSEHFKKRHTIVTKDNVGQFREFVIINTVETLDGWVLVRTQANHTDLLKTAKPIEPKKLERVTVNQFQDFMLADTTIKRAPDTEYGGVASSEWESYRRRDEIESIGENAFKMRADYYIEIDENHNKQRYQRFKKVEPLFKGFDIIYGKNMLGLKREIDTTDVVTSLLCLGPEDTETGNRLVEVVQDEEAMQQFGIRHKWGLYEPQSEDKNMTAARLRSLGRTELNKRKMASVTYEVTTLDYNERVSTGFNATVGDMVRVKNEDFSPELYVDAEIIGLDYDQLSGITTYRFGVIREYTRDDVYEWLNRNLNTIREQLKNFQGNTETLIEDIQHEFKDLYEFKIIESNTPPTNPENGQLWLDTTHKNRGVSTLYRYNQITGQWDKVTPTKAHEVGAITKEEAWYSELVQTLEAVNIAHSGYTNEVTEVLNNRYYVDDASRSRLNSLFGQLDRKIKEASSMMNAMSGSNATLGELAKVQSLFVEYRTILVNLLKELANARTLIEERFRLLQSQYTVEKFNEAMEKVADSIGGTFDGTNIIADIPNQEDLKQLNKDIKDYLTGQIDTLDDTLGKKVASDIKTARDELSASIGSVDKKVDGIQVGGRNLLQNTQDFVVGKDKELIANYIYVNQADFYTLSFVATLAEFLNSPKKSEIEITYTVMDIMGTKEETITKIIDVSDMIVDDNTPQIKRVHKVLDMTGWYLLTDLYIDSSKTHTNGREFSNFQFEQGTVPTAYSKAPEDMENKVSNITQTVTKHDTSIGLLEKEISLKANSSDVTQQLDNALKPLQSTVNANKAEIQVQAGLINGKVSSTQYTTDMNNVTRDLQTATSERKQLAESISQTVSVDEYSKGTENLIKGSDYPFKSTVYLLARYNLSEDWKDNTTYTLTVKGTTTSDDLKVWRDNGLAIGSIGALEKKADDLYQLTFTTKNYTGSDRRTLSIYQGVNDGATRSGQIEWIKLERGSIATPYSKSPQDTEEVLTRYNTEINQAKESINQRVSYEQFNKSNKTLERLITSLNQTSTGLEFIIDTNGIIQGFNLNKDKFRFDSKMIEFNDGDVVIKDGVTSITQAFIDSLFANTAFIYNLKALDIDFNRATAVGTNGSNTLLITSDRVEQRGIFNRQYHGVSYNYDVTTTLRGGYLRFGDNTQQRAINMSAFGISTYLDGNGEWAGSVGSSGYIQWWDGQYSPSNANGITMGSYNVVALKSDNNRIVLDAEASISIESKSAPVYLYPYKRDRPGVNRFNFTTSTSSDATSVNGYIMYGSDENYKYGVGLRFNKNQNTNLLQVVDGDYTSSGKTQLEVGTLWAFDVRDRSTNSYYYKNGTSGRDIDDGVNPRAQLQSSSMVTNRGDRDMYLGTRGGAVHITDEKGQNTSGTTTYMDLRFSHAQMYGHIAHHGTGGWFYIGAGGTNGVRFTNNNWTDGGYKNIQFQEWKAWSSESAKTEIEKWNLNVLEILKNELQLYRYKFKQNVGSEFSKFSHGIILRSNSNEDEFPVEWRDEDAFNGNEVLWWNTKAIQELAFENDTLKSEIAELKSQINKIMEMIA